MKEVKEIPAGIEAMFKFPLTPKTIEDKNPPEISIRSLSYNNNLSALLTENILFTVSTQDKNKVFKSLLQTFYWRDNILITLLYQQRTNTTTVVTKIPNQKPQKQVLPGLTALFLKTNDANLEYGYK